MNSNDRLYKILLLWSQSDEQQQTDHNWPLHIMRMTDFYFTMPDIDVSFFTHSLSHTHSETH